MSVNIENPEKCSKIASDVVDQFAGVCNRIIAKENKEDPSFNETLPSVVAGAIQFVVKTLIVAGFEKKYILMAMAECYDNVENDPDVLRARKLRDAFVFHGTTNVQ